MRAVRAIEFRDNFKGLCELAVGGETVIVSRPHGKNVVLISEDEYNDMNKARRNAEYSAKLARGFRDIEDGKGLTFTSAELDAMADE